MEATTRSPKVSNNACEVCHVDVDVNGIRYAKMALDLTTKYYCQSCVKADEHVIETKVCSHCEKEVSETIKLRVEKKPVQAVTPVHITKGTGTADVWYGYGSGTHVEENIAYPNGHEKAGQPIPFSSRQEKAAAMKIAGVREAGDRVKGMRNEDMVLKNRKKYFC